MLKRAALVVMVLAHAAYAERVVALAPFSTLGAEDRSAGTKKLLGQIEQAIDTMKARLTILAPEEEEAMLRAAGFSGVSLFYAGMSFRGWVAYAE